VKSTSLTACDEGIKADSLVPQRGTIFERFALTIIFGYLTKLKISYSEGIMTQGSKRDPKKMELERKATRYALIAGVLAFMWHAALVRGLRMDGVIFRSALIGIGVWGVIRFDVLAMVFPFLEGTPFNRIRDGTGDDYKSDEADFEFDRDEPEKPSDWEDDGGKQPHSLLPNARIYTVKLPYGTLWQPELANSLMLRLADVGMAFAITAEYSAVRWQIFDLAENSKQRAEHIRGAILAVYPAAEVNSELLIEPQVQKRFYRAMFSVAQSSMFAGPILYPSELKAYDPLTLLGNMIGELLPDERITYLVSVGNINPKFIKDTQKMLERSLSENIVVNILLNLLRSPSINKERFTPEETKIFLQKLTGPSTRLFAAYLQIEIDTPSFERLMHLASGVETTFLEFSGEHQSLYIYGDFNRLTHEITNPARVRETSIYNALSKRLPELTGKKQISNYGRLKVNWLGAPSKYIPGECCIFNTKELASLWHLPHDEYKSPTIERVNTKAVRVPFVLRKNTRGVCLGNNVYGGIQTAVQMLDDDRKAHMIILGKTEMGKSTLMHHMIRYDIA
jgi:hypothetical protein